ncbi:RusA family crossover junction endodeoxyribonuclease [Novosphingobium lindaniclasticum]|uniref:RusA family crossover junction endodeoxyribonuclease n=1 Tax=Novosphingobium lindaniclasticum TaxID=1329895 RepID=UPI00059434CD|nr:RusA family crossover junction endodeoxyribonuclease [Novosphingobium lindaniclasticum]
MPTPRPRARVIAAAGRRPIASFYSPKEYQEWQKEAAAALKGVPAFPIDGPCTVSIVCEVAKPKTTKLAAPKPDVDNYAKGVLDAITKDGRFWSDDSQVVGLWVSKTWTEGAPGIHVAISKEL